jgi:hypothetical protein
MPKIPFEMKTTQFLLENRKIKQGRGRGYLGMSGLNAKCSRALWYGFHWASPPQELDIRTKRIFDRGNLEEERIISELLEVGIEVYKVIDGAEVPMTGSLTEVQEEIIGFAGHAKGHPDGRVRGLPESSKPHLLEMKTAKESKFKEFVKKGVKEANKVYYGQVQIYMHRLGLERALFIVSNKNTEERYYERIRYDKDYAEALVHREMGIITSDSPPDKISENRNWIDCKFCNHTDVCHNSAQPSQNCRTCDCSDILDDGKWECSYHGKEITQKEQEVGCPSWRRGWGL